jgi:predicted TIM-barrel enzyme
MMTGVICIVDGYIVDHYCKANGQLWLLVTTANILRFHENLSILVEK